MPVTAPVTATAVFAQQDTLAQQVPTPGNEIDRLSQAYYAALDNPDTPLGFIAAAPEERNTPFSLVTDQSGDLTLEEFTSGILDIATLAERLDPHGDPTRLITDPFAQTSDVLWLFAPKGLTPVNHRHPPARARQDHHRIGLDSHFRPASASAPAAPSAPVSTAPALPFTDATPNIAPDADPWLGIRDTLSSARSTPPAKANP